MKVPDGMTEEQVIEIIDRISNKLAYKFTFGFFTHQDIKQQGIIEGIEGLEEFIPKFPLENFMWVHIRNRLINFKRNNFMRYDKPCAKCPFDAYVKKGDICKKYKIKEDCELYAAWIKKNQIKKNIMNPVSIGAVVDDSESNMFTDGDQLNDLSHVEIISIIENEISVENRPLWLQLKGGMKLTRVNMQKLKSEIEIILQDYKDVTQGW